MHPSLSPASGGPSLRDRVRPTPGWPWRLLSEFLHPAIRAVLAALAAWEVGLLLGTRPAAYFAVFASLAAIHPTVARSIRQTGFYAASVLMSVLLVLAVDEITRVVAAELGLAIGAAVLIGRTRLFGRSGDTLAYWSLLLIVVGGHPPSSYLRERLPEAAVGLVIGVSVNLLVFPRLRIRPVRRSVQALREDLADVLVSAGDELAESWPPQDTRWADQAARLERRGADLQRAAADVSDSTRWNPRARVQKTRQEIRAQFERTQSLQRITWAVTGILRTLAAVAAMEGTSAQFTPDFRQAYARMLRGLESPLREDGELGGAGHPVDLTNFSRERARLQSGVEAARDLDSTRWLYEALLVLQLAAIQPELASDEPLLPAPLPLAVGQA